MTQLRHRHDAPTDLGDTLVESDVVTSGTARRALAALRISYGVVFLWAFFDKLLALGFNTGAVRDDAGVKTGTDFLARDVAWLNGGSPTEGFLTFGVPADNPFRGTFNAMAGQAVWDWLFMVGLLGIGVALLTGIGMRIAAATGALLYLLMYAALLPLQNNPVVDDHLISAIVLPVLALTLAGDTWGAGKAWARTRLVRRIPVLR